MEKSEIIKEFLQKANITNVHIYQEILNGKLDIMDDVVKNAVTQPSIYQELFNKYCKSIDDNVLETTENTQEAAIESATESEKIVEDNDNDDTNDIKFNIDDKEYVYKGDPKNTIASAFKNLKIKGTVYNDGTAVSVKDSIDTLTGLTLTKTKPETTTESAETAETTEA